MKGPVGAGRYERSVDTRLGSLNLKIPQLRTGSYFPGFLEPRRTVEKALVAVIQEARIAGVSTRRVDDLVQAMGLSGISKSSVSKLCMEIDERVSAFLTRPLSGAWPYLWLDATYLKVREGGRIVSVAAIVAVAVDTEGRREIVGLHIGPSKAAAPPALLSDLQLKQRLLREAEGATCSRSLRTSLVLWLALKRTAAHAQPGREQLPPPNIAQFARASP
ncbi:hypothetical protein LDDCCGHA_0724 [Methylobacterium oxalidis]|nr:hypothetical protein LDDCCGHA_0724 [Methylobacterium oxalidis]